LTLGKPHKVACNLNAHGPLPVHIRHEVRLP
jgi:hypothetical protein